MALIALAASSSDPSSRRAAVPTSSIPTKAKKAIWKPAEAPPPVGKNPPSFHRLRLRLMDLRGGEAGDDHHTATTIKEMMATT
jgi:hypothetical protein